jgi:hypothetical protein
MVFTDECYALQLVVLRVGLEGQASRDQANEQ